MKKLHSITVLAALIMPIAAQAVLLGQGTQELRFSQSYLQNAPSGGSFELAAGYGYFVMDSWEVGVLGNFSDNDLATIYQLGLYTEYNFETGTDWIPYVGGLGSLAMLDADGGESSSAFVLRGDLGAKYYLKEDVALFGSFNLSAATDDVFVDDGSLGNTNFGIEMGLRIYFGE